eukprot:GHVL01013202.1.p1 GENE.GHVL01013202.1~~GHVL01013202.1.p1  ORF type:complete len:772 (-),score=148.94 GHVL01013202.1:2138-4453(-)
MPSKKNKKSNKCSPIFENTQPSIIYSKTPFIETSPKTPCIETSPKTPCSETSPKTPGTGSSNLLTLVKAECDQVYGTRIEVNHKDLTRPKDIILSYNSYFVVAQIKPNTRLPLNNAAVSKQILKSLNCNIGDKVECSYVYRCIHASYICISPLNKEKWSTKDLRQLLASRDRILALCNGKKFFKNNIIAWWGEHTGTSPSFDMDIQWLLIVPRNKDESIEYIPYLVNEKTKIDIVLGEGYVKEKKNIKLGGLKSVMKQLTSLVKLPLTQPQIFEKYHVKPPRGVLLYGPPGTGKTLLCRFLSEELENENVHVELMNAGDIMSKFQGEAEEKLKKLFKDASHRQAIGDVGTCVFIDEIDALCPTRENDCTIVATFLSLLDGLNKQERMIIIGTTNRPNAIDPALRRAGRFERELEVGVPNVSDRLDILKVILESVPHSLTDEEILEVAQRANGFVGADLSAVCSKSALFAIDRCDDDINFNDFDIALQQTRPSALKELLVEIPCIRWSDIGGYEDVKNSLKEAVEWPLKYDAAFRQMKINPPKGILLYGPPGCSKTMMAKAVATESQMNFIAVRGPELFSKWVGESERQVREIFRKGRQNSPCIIFFDEIDSIGGCRDNTSSVDSRVLSQVLNEMDGIGYIKQVIVIGATNRPDSLDSALVRPGRFDRLVYVPLPDYDGRLIILTNTLKKVPNNISFEEITDLAHETDGYSGAELTMLCREAGMDALRNSLPLIDLIKINFENIKFAKNMVKPRIPKSLIQYYENFQKTIKK